MAQPYISFNNIMARATHENIKTQTRRLTPFSNYAPIDALDGLPVVGFEPYAVNPVKFGAIIEQQTEVDDTKKFFYECPYGKVGSRLYVKESWATLAKYDKLKPTELPDDAPIWWMADGDKPAEYGRKRSKRFLPKRFARVWLEITDIRVERVGDISEADAEAEGARYWSQKFALDTDHRTEQWCRYSARVAEKRGLPRPGAATTLGAFAYLWDSINSDKPGCSFADSPYVWALTFKRVESESANAA